MWTIFEPGVYDPKWAECKEYVYFVQAEEGTGLIKIGSTENPETRLKSLQSACPVPLIIIRLIPGDMDLEREVHRYFSNERKHGEWFAPSDRLLRWIVTIGDRDTRKACRPVKPTVFYPPQCAEIQRKIDNLRNWRHIG